MFGSSINIFPLCSEGLTWNSDQAVELAKQIDLSDAMTFQGLYTHCGQSYYAKDKNHVSIIADEVVGRLLSLVERYQSYETLVLVTTRLTLLRIFRHHEL